MIKILDKEFTLDNGERFYQYHNSIYCELPEKQGGIFKPLCSMDIYGDITARTSYKDVFPLYCIDKMALLIKKATLEAWRQPTPQEIRFGHGAIHYKDMPVSLWLKHCPHGGFPSLKTWVKCPHDGLRYYR